VGNKYSQVRNFKYLSCEISYDNEKEIFNNIRKFSEILGIINNTFKPTVVHKFSRIKVYKTLALSILSYWSEIRTLRKEDKKFDINRYVSFQKKSRYTLCDHKRNEEIWEELKVETFDEKLRRYKSNWLRHIPRKKNKRMPKIMLNDRPRRRRWLGRPLKRLLDEAETGLSRPNSWRMMRMMIMMINYFKPLKDIEKCVYNSCL